METMCLPSRLILAQSCALVGYTTVFNRPPDPQTPLLLEPVIRLITIMVWLWPWLSLAISWKGGGQASRRLGTKERDAVSVCKARRMGCYNNTIANEFQPVEVGMGIACYDLSSPCRTPKPPRSGSFGFR